MATQTKPAPRRRPRSAGVRAAPPYRSRGPTLRRRREPEPSGVMKLIGGLLPAAAARKAMPGSKKGAAGGFVLAAAAGMAFKNRDKLARLRQERSRTPATESDATAPPTTADGSPHSGL
jgi:hypothetical protein